MKELLVIRGFYFVFVTGFVSVYDNLVAAIYPLHFFTHSLECRVVHSAEFYVTNEVVDDRVSRVHFEEGFSST